MHQAELGDIRQWRALQPDRQGLDLEDPEKRQGVFSSALLALVPHLSTWAPDNARWLQWVDFLAWMQAAPQLPPSLRLPIFLRHLSLLDPGCEPAASAWPVAPDFDIPASLDQELDTLNHALEAQDFATLAALAGYMAEDVTARRLLVRRLQELVSADNYRLGLRLILVDQWADLEESMSAELFRAFFLGMAQAHFSFPSGTVVVVPEGKASQTEEGRTPLLTALRQRDLPAFLLRVRAMGDEPVAGIRQLLLVMGMLILERGAHDHTDRQALALSYLRLLALLKMRHASLRRARKTFFSAAVQVFEHAGWTNDSHWPRYAALLEAYQSSDGNVSHDALSWEYALQCLRTGRLESWYCEFAEVVPQKEDLFWAVWLESQRAVALTGGPLTWIHVLIPLRLYGQA